MYVNKKKPLSGIFTIRKFDSFKTCCLKRRRSYRDYLRFYSGLPRKVIRRMTLRELLSKCIDIRDFM